MESRGCDRAAIKLAAGLDLSHRSRPVNALNDPTTFLKLRDQSESFIAKTGPWHSSNEGLIGASGQVTASLVEHQKPTYASSDGALPLTSSAGTQSLLRPAFCRIQLIHSSESSRSACL